jgi:hypothetical protein
MFINHVRVQAAHDREHGWSISFTLCRGLHTLPTTRIKALKNFKPNHAMLAKHHTTLPRCDCIGTLWSLYKDMQKTNNPHNYGSGRTITLPSDQHLSKGCYPKGPGYTHATPIPLCSFRKRATSTITHLINSLRSETCDTVVAPVFLGGSPCSDSIKYSYINPKHWSLNIKHFQ